MPFLKNKFSILIFSLIILFSIGFFLPSRASAVFGGGSYTVPNEDIGPNGGGNTTGTNQGGTTSGGQVDFTNPIPVKTIPELVDHISDWLTGIVAGVAVIMIMYAGFQYVIYSSNSKQTDSAKTTIKNSVIGLVIIFGANIIIDEINYLMGVTTSSSSFFNFSNRIITWGFGIIIGISVLMIMYAGWLFMSGGEDANKRKQAQGIITYVVIGIIVTALAAVIVRVVTGIF